jgi:hypothetical protein
MKKLIRYIRKNYKFLTIVLVILVAAIIIGRQVSIAMTSQALKQLAGAKTAVGQLILLPTDEEPTLAIVEDTSQLSNQFLKDNAKKGDEILVYATKGQAIIYRPSINKVVAVSPVTIDLGLAEAEGTTISVLNGTSDPNIAETVKKDIESKYPNATVTTSNASNRNLPNTIIIDNTDQKDNLVEGLTTIVKGKRGVVPLSESAGTSNILIIVGTDRL